MQGMSATVAVYLSVKGGLSVFAQGGKGVEPNGYVLFLSCLVAAVYSEDIWERVRTTMIPGGDDDEPDDAA